MNEGSKVLVNVVTGAQGAGKTSLIAKLLEGGAHEERAVVILNEAGEVGIRGEQLGTRLCAVSVLTTGCICCGASEEFASQALALIEEFQPHRLLVETSGHADPSRVLAAFYQHETLAARVTIEPSICVLDTARFHDQLAHAGVRFLAQLQNSAVVVLNKLEELEPGRVEAVRREVESLNPRAWIQENERGNVPLSVLFMRRVQPSAGVPEEHGYSCFAYEAGAVMDRERLERTLKRMPRELFRLQGFVKTGDGTFRLDYVTGRYDFEPAPAHEAGPLVFVGRGLNKGRLFTLLDRCRVQAGAA